MTQPLILTAQQAQELHTTGRLTGYREKCEWQPPTIKRCIVGMDSDGKWFSLYEEYTPNGWVNGEKKLTPPRDTNTAYAVLEPCWFDTHEQTWTYGNGEPPFTFDAPLCKPDQVRQHARITDRKLIISTEEDGELWWDMDLEKVG